MAICVRGGLHAQYAIAKHPIGLQNEMGLLLLVSEVAGGRQLDSEQLNLTKQRARIDAKLFGRGRAVTPVLTNRISN